MIRSYQFLGHYIASGSILIFGHSPESEAVQINANQTWQKVRELETNDIYWYDSKTLTFVLNHPSIERLMDEE